MSAWCVFSSANLFIDDNNNKRENSTETQLSREHRHIKTLVYERIVFRLFSEVFTFVQVSAGSECNIIVTAVRRFTRS